MLQILCGPDRTANSMRILDQICENARAGVAGQILIVPEQYSHETERALCARGGDTISRYAEVLSFTRLAARVFSVCGGVCEEYLDENGRVLTLYLAAQQVREQLKFYAAVMTRPDFLRQLGALMEELLTSCIPPDALHAAAARLEGRLAQKVTELALLYESYLAVCKTGRGDPVTRQMRLRDLLDETDFLDGRTVFLDGFSDFTALQQQILAAILAHAEAVHVSVLTSGGEQAACQTGNETKKRLQQLAARQGVEAAVCRVTTRAPRDPAVQSWLDGLFFGGPAESGAPQNISLVQAGSWQAACAYAARQIRSGAASGLRYRDFTVCMTDEAACALPMQTLLSRAGIPVYSAANAPLLKKPLVAALLSALQAILRYEQGPMLSFLKSGFSPVSEDECDRLERYVHYWNIRGQLWEKPWQMHPRGLGLPMTPEDTQALEELDRIREQAVVPLRRLRLAFAKAPDTDARLRAIASFWEELDVAGRLQAQSEALAAAGQVVLFDCREPYRYAASDGLEFSWLLFNGLNTRAFYRRILQAHGGRQVFMPSGVSEIAQLLDSIFTGCAADERPGEAQLSQMLHRILGLLLLDDTSPAHAGSDRIAEAIRYMNRHLFEELSVQEVAASVSLSSSHFSRQFKAKTGYSPYEYIILRRIDKAKYLLTSTQLSVKEIAYATGYNSEENFIHSFRSNVGIAPGLFRKHPI